MNNTQTLNWNQTQQSFWNQTQNSNFNRTDSLWGTGTFSASQQLRKTGFDKFRKN